MPTTTKKTVKRTPKFNYKTIKTFADACKKLSVDPTKLPDVAGIPEEFSNPIAAVYKLMIIYKAINNGWIPDWNNYEQKKYYPWFSALKPGSGFAYWGYAEVDDDSIICSRLCVDSLEKAMFIAEQFQTEYKEYYLYSE